MFTKEVNEHMLGYRLTMERNGQWKFTSRDGFFIGNSDQVSTFMMVEYGFERSEITYAANQIHEFKSIGAMFGIMKKFMYTIGESK